jgi:dethiobiotin synthetase
VTQPAPGPAPAPPPPVVLPPVLIVSGTGTEVGKTVVTAAVAALAASRGRRVAVVKPVQTGEPPGPTGDLAVIRRLSGVTGTHELARFPDPLSPEAAARAAGRPPLDLAVAAVVIKQLRFEADLVLVEGAGGLLVRYDPAGRTIADLAAMLDAPVLVVTTAGLGTLNHTALTLEALSTRRLAAAGVVIGAWPAEPGLAERANLTDLAVIAGQPLAGAIAAGAARLSRADFLAAARAGLGPALGGAFQAETN